MTYLRCDKHGCKRKVFENGRCKLHAVMHEMESPPIVSAKPMLYNATYDAEGRLSFEGLSDRESAERFRHYFGLMQDSLADVYDLVMECDRKSTKIADQDDWIRFYRMPCGPWHRLLGQLQRLQPAIGKQTEDWKRFQELERTPKRKPSRKDAADA